MKVRRLDHFTLRTPQLEATCSFFEEVVGLVAGPRPPFHFPGYWLYAGDTPLVHMAAHDPTDPHLTAYLGDRPVGDDTGVLDHIALRCEDLPAFEVRLKALGQAYRARTVPACGEHQVFVVAPGRLTVEFIFDSRENASWAANEAGVAVEAQ